LSKSTNVTPNAFWATREKNNQTRASKNDDYNKQTKQKVNNKNKKKEYKKIGSTYEQKITNTTTSKRTKEMMTTLHK